MASSNKAKQEAVDRAAKAKAQPVIDEYNAKLKALEEKEKQLNERDATLDKRDAALKEWSKQLEDVDKAVKEAEDAAREKAEADIRALERDIRENEREAIIAEAKEKADKMISDAEEAAKGIAAKAEKELEEQRLSIEADKKAAADARAEAIREKEQVIRDREQQQADFLADLEKHNENVEKRFNEQFVTLQRMQDELALKRVSLEEEQSDVEEDRKYIKALKDKYAAYSQAEVDRLNGELDIVTADLEKKNELLEQKNQEIIDLRGKLGDTGGKRLEEEIARLTQERDEALDAFADMPGADRIAELENIEREYEALKREMAELKELKDKLERELSRVHTSQTELESKKAEAKALDALNAQLQAKLNFISETYKANRESKFAGLLEIDRAKAPAARRGTAEPVSLMQIVSYVRAWGATRGDNPLYYSEETIRVFVASLAASFDASRLMILQGLSGTGKTSLPRLFAESLGLTCDLVSVQPSWRDNRELLGYDNDFTNRFKETEFTKFVYAASKDQKKITIIILDEMNLARIEYYFADFLSELERRLDEGTDVWTVPLISNYSEELEEERPGYLSYDSGSARLKVGKNVWFIGTANNDDSTSTITDKVYDRAQILDLDRRADSFEAVKPDTELVLSLPTLERLFNAAGEIKENRLTQDDWDKIHRLDKENLRNMDITFGSRIKTQLEAFVPVYVACGGTKEKAIDYYLAHKILRKLDEKFDAYIRDELKELQKKLDQLFGKKVFTESASKIRVLLRRNFSQHDDGE